MLTIPSSLGTIVRLTPQPEAKPSGPEQHNGHSVAITDARDDPWPLQIRPLTTASLAML